MKFWDKFRKSNNSEIFDSTRVSSNLKSNKKRPLKTTNQLSSYVNFHTSDFITGRFRYQLYRFLTDNIPIINSCVSTWVRLSAAPGRYIIDSEKGNNTDKAEECLKALANRIYYGPSGNSKGLVTFLAEIFNGLYRDGIFAGMLTVNKDGRGVDKFIQLDAADLIQKDNKLFLEIDNRQINLDTDDFYYIPLNSDLINPLGRSILKSVPFVTYIEQQLVDDMRRSNHNAGFSRLHVKITPPERISGESDKTFYDRINNYFDSTVSMIKSCEVDENPVTWDNIAIESIGPSNVRAVTNSWFMNHRAVIEEICAGTGLAPFLLGYSYGATTSWSGFKFDIVMRQVNSIQSEAAAFMEWMGNIELALAGFDLKCKFEFDNTFAYRASEQAEIRSREVDNLLKLYQAGLIDEKEASEKAGRII